MTIIGIDLGTTHSLAASFYEDGVKLIPNSLGKYLTPSVVSIDDDGTILVGESAKNRLLTHPDKTASVFKRDMGTSRQYELGNRKFIPQELSSFIIRSLVEDAENFLGKKIDEAVISVPAYFNDTQRKATKNAGALAGVKVERIINEPTAAAIAYGLHEKYEEGIFLILDLGGGTFDVSILEFTDNIIEVHAVAGNNHLGGEDFTYIIIGLILRKNELHKDNLSKKEYTAIYRFAEKCKFDLCHKKIVQEKIILGKQTLEFKISEDEFLFECRDLLDKIQKPMETAFRDANIYTNNLDEIILVGGATRMPVFRDIIHKLFKRIPSSSINPDEVIGLGCGIQAALKSKDKNLNEVILTDICPYSLGTSVVQEIDENKMDGYFLPIINRNSTIPVSREVRLHTVHDFQSFIDIKVYQGEHRLVKNNIFLGEIKVRVPSARAGEIYIDLRYTYDINGLLEVEANVPKTNVTKRIIIEENPGVLSKEEIEVRFKKLAELKIHPRENAENKAFMTRGERLWSEYLDENKNKIGRILAEFEGLLEKQNTKEIEKFRTEYSNWFDTIDNGI